MLATNVPNKKKCCNNIGLKVGKYIPSNVHITHPWAMVSFIGIKDIKSMYITPVRIWSVHRTSLAASYWLRGLDNHSLEALSFIYQMMLW